MTEAINLYNELCDLDFMDYNDSYDSDISFIKSVIECYGVKDARQILKEYFN